MSGKNGHRKTLAATVFLASCFLWTTCALAYTGTITDNFNATNLNSGLWADISTGGPSIAQTAGQLQVTIPGSSSGAWSGGVQSKFTLIGDFDMQADFSLLTWPDNNGIRVGIQATGAVERVGARAGFYEEYLADFGSPLLGRVLTGDLSGTLRMTRTGNTLEGFYLAGGSWHSLGSREVSGFGADTKINLNTWSSDPFFGYHDATVAFDNFQVQYTGVQNLVPIPPTALLLGFGLLSLGAPGLLRRVRKG
jgi:hypothetical protein